MVDLELAEGISDHHPITGIFNIPHFSPQPIEIKHRDTDLFNKSLNHITYLDLDIGNEDLVAKFRKELRDKHIPPSPTSSKDASDILEKLSLSSIQSLRKLLKPVTRARKLSKDGWSRSSSAIFSQLRCALQMRRKLIGSQLKSPQLSFLQVRPDLEQSIRLFKDHLLKLQLTSDMQTW
jgi:hypothetical protein